MTNEQRAEVIRRYARNESPVSIGARLGLSRWAVLRAAKAAGLELQAGGRAPVPLVVREAVIDAARREGVVAAARAFGISRVTVWRLAR